VESRFIRILATLALILSFLMTIAMEKRRNTFQSLKTKYQIQLRAHGKQFLGMIGKLEKNLALQNKLKGKTTAK
jgi:hypothetical protein